MVTCENCIHYDVCEYRGLDKYPSEQALKDDCSHFMGKQSVGCDYCKQGDEKCGTCVEFFKGMDGCAAECDNEKCIAYKPVHYCPFCGARMKGGAE